MTRIEQKQIGPQPTTLTPDGARVSTSHRLIKATTKHWRWGSTQKRREGLGRETHSDIKNGEVPEAEQGRDCASRPLRWSQGGYRPRLRRWYSGSSLRPLFGCRDKQVPQQGHPQGFGKKDG